jgi:hypothetical protein
MTPTYQERLNRHLASYKSEILGISELGMYRHRDRELSYEHILPLEHAWKNVFEPISERLRTHVSGPPPIKLHRYFHHLNSSQAFAFNFFFPYLWGSAEAAEVLLTALGMNGPAINACFEMIPNQAEGTNVDVAWRKTSGQVYCEVKLSEAEFGTADADDRHRDKLTKIYRPVLDGAVAEHALEETYFFEHYQLLRNVALVAADPKAELLFLLPADNKPLVEQLATFLPVITEDLRRRISVVYVEEAIQRLVAAHRSEHALHLQRKYVLI